MFPFVAIVGLLVPYGDPNKEPRNTPKRGCAMFGICFCGIVLFSFGLDEWQQTPHLVLTQINYEKYDFTSVRVGKCTSTAPKVVVEGCIGYATFKNTFTPTTADAGERKNIQFETRKVFEASAIAAAVGLSDCKNSINTQTQDFYKQNKIDDDGDGTCYVFDYVLQPTFVADWSANENTWVSLNLYGTYKKNDQVYGSLQEIANDVENTWDRSSRCNAAARNSVLTQFLGLILTVGGSLLFVISVFDPQKLKNM